MIPVCAGVRANRRVEIEMRREDDIEEALGFISDGLAWARVYRARA